MSDISAGNFVSTNQSDSFDRVSIVTTVLSALLIIGLPAVFWVSVMEFVNYVLALGISSNVRLTIAGVIVTLLAMIWGVVQIAASQRRGHALNASLLHRRQHA